MTYNELPGRIRKTFNEEEVARIARRANKNGRNLTVVTKSGFRYRYVLMGDTYVWYETPKAARKVKEVEPPAVEMPSFKELGYADAEEMSRADFADLDFVVS